MFCFGKDNSCLRLHQSIWLFLGLLFLLCCIGQWPGWSNGDIIGHHFHGLWMSTVSRSSASQPQGLMQAILAIRAWRFWLCAACGSTSRASLFLSAFFFRHKFHVNPGIWMSCPVPCLAPGFILERNMHFVVANIVMPVTQSKRISFVTLWGGRQVDYFVSLGIYFWQSASWFVRLVQAAPSHPSILGKVSLLGRQLSTLSAIHWVPCSVQRGPRFLVLCSILDLFVCDLEENTGHHWHVTCFTNTAVERDVVGCCRCPCWRSFWAFDMGMFHWDRRYNWATFETLASMFRKGPLASAWRKQNSDERKPT